LVEVVGSGRVVEVVGDVVVVVVGTAEVVGGTVVVAVVVVGLVVVVVVVDVVVVVVVVVAMVDVVELVDVWAPAVKLPRIVVGCMSQKNVYVPSEKVTFHVALPVPAIVVPWSTPGPCRWKLWEVAESLTLIV
jgi:hypothetical protein